MDASDPYFEVKAEVLSALSLLPPLLSSYTSLSSSSPSSPSTLSALAELRATLQAVEADTEELDESVAAVEETGVARRLGIAQQEVGDRRNFVERVRGEIEAIKAQLPVESASPETNRKRLSAHQQQQGYFPPLSPSHSFDEQRDGQDEFEMQHQTILIEQQDRTLTSISGTVDLLRQQARVMGREVVDQNGLLDEIDQQVDRTGSKLERAQRRMDRFIASNKNSASSWAIFGLIVILCFLLFIILFL